jgi:hypothetical protein
MAKREDGAIDIKEYFSTHSAILEYGIRKYEDVARERRLLTDGMGRDAVEIMSFDRVAYINILGAGYSSEDACAALGIDVVQPYLWLEEEDKDGIMHQCMSLLKRMQADTLEEDVWEQAIRNPKATILKMFALKARKDEYKDNAQPVTNIQTNLHVTIGGKDYDISANYKDVTESTGETISEGT